MKYIFTLVKDPKLLKFQWLLKKYYEGRVSQEHPNPPTPSHSAHTQTAPVFSIREADIYYSVMPLHQSPAVFPIPSMFILFQASRISFRSQSEMHPLEVRLSLSSPSAETSVHSRLAYTYLRGLLFSKLH